MKKRGFAWSLILLSAVVVGQNRSSRKELEAINVNFMVSGYFYAGSKIPDRTAVGGFGPSENLPKPVTPNMKVRLGVVSLVAEPNEERAFAEKYKGLRVLLVNTTKEQIAFEAQDSRLYIVQEAVDRDFKWKPIEYLPNSLCGNSLHRVFLGPNEYWEFAAPRYTGTMKTRLRFCLVERKLDGGKVTFCSNEFNGSVNSKQFVVPQVHMPPGIIVPNTN